MYVRTYVHLVHCAIVSGLRVCVSQPWRQSNRGKRRIDRNEMNYWIPAEAEEREGRFGLYILLMLSDPAVQSRSIVQPAKPSKQATSSCGWEIISFDAAAAAAAEVLQAHRLSVSCLFRVLREGWNFWHISTTDVLMQWSVPRKGREEIRASWDFGYCFTRDC